MGRIALSERGEEEIETYISERVIGLELLEDKIRSAYLASDSLVELIQKENPPMDQISGLAKQMNEMLLEISEFELCIVQRKILREA